jgi:hypothetical protein
MVISVLRQGSIGDAFEVIHILPSDISANDRVLTSSDRCKAENQPKHFSGRSSGSQSPMTALDLRGFELIQ